MAEVIVSDVVERLVRHFGKLDVQKREQMAPYFGGMKNVIQLEDALTTIQQRLPSVERRGEMDEAEVKDWLARLKHVVYRLEDLIEEAGMAENEKEHAPGGKVIKPLCILVSHPSLFRVKKRVSQQIEALVVKLVDIISHMPSIEEKEPQEEDELPTFDRRQKKKRIIQLLTGSDPEAKSTAIVAIHGTGGIGKSALAKFVYRDKHVERYFKLKGWVGMGYNNLSNWETLLKDVATSMMLGDDCYQLSVDQLEIRLKESIKSNRFLLAIDGFSGNDDRFLRLMDLLSEGRQGYKILITTEDTRLSDSLRERNIKVADFDLCSPSEEQRLEMFLRLPLPNLPPPDICRDTVRKCRGIPNIIQRLVKAAGDREDFSSQMKLFQSDYVSPHDVQLPLKIFNYYNLPLHLKQCLAYCSLFPSNYVFDKDSLLCLWTAQGFIEADDLRCRQELGDEYFGQLLKHQFIEPVATTGYKMDADVLDFLQRVTGDEFRLIAGPDQTINTTDNLRHVSFVIDSSWEPPSWLLAANRLRSLLLLPSQPDRPITVVRIDKLFTEVTGLRALVLGKADCGGLANSLKKLKHLRCLRLGGTLGFLPECTRSLPYLETLDLQACHLLKHIQRGFSNYRILDSSSSLIVGESSGLDTIAIRSFEKLKIYFKEKRENAKLEARYAKLKEDMKLTDLALEWSSLYAHRATLDDNDEEMILQHLQPPASLNRLTIRFWKGKTLPSWGMDSHRCFLQNLVSVEIEGCGRCQSLPTLSLLPSLKNLHLSNLGALEYVESASVAVSEAYFPLLEDLMLEELPTLKAWSMLKNDKCLFNVSTLKLYNCPKLMSMPRLPKLRSLSAEEVPGALVDQFQDTPNLEKLLVASSSQLLSLRIPGAGSLWKVRIEQCQELVSLSSERKGTISLLEIQNCSKLRQIWELWQHVALVFELNIWNCEQLEMWDTVGNHNNSRNSSLIPLEKLSLVSRLAIGNITKLERIPEVFACFTSLSKLKIYHLRNLRSLPDWIASVNQLLELTIVSCPRLRELPKSIRELKYLRLLHISHCEELDLREYERETPLLPVSLRFMTLEGLSRVQSLPCDLLRLEELYIYHLPNLKALPNSTVDSKISNLVIGNCLNLMALPQSFSDLQSLKQLQIRGCPVLIERCRPQTGEDWPLIQHVSEVQLQDD